MRKPTQRWEPEESRYDPVFAAQRKRAKKLSLQQLKKQGKLGKATWRAKTRIADSPTSHSLAFLPLPCPAMPPAEFDLPEEWIRLVQSDPPPKYRLLRQNLYSHPSLRPRTAGREDEVPLCSCRSDAGGCDHSCMNRQLFMECPVGRCPSLRDGELYCGNMVIQQGKFPATEVFRTQGRGWALRTREEVEKGTLLIEYRGEVVTMEEAQTRMRSMSAGQDYYFAALEGELVLDAGPMGSEARFANHSCAPNCVLQKWRAGGEAHILLVAARRLGAGEEVTYNYQVDTLAGMFGKQACRCGAKNCSGLIGKRPEGKGEDWEGWKERAAACLAMRAPSLEAVEALVQEGEEGVELEVLQDKLRAAQGWQRRWRALQGGWLEGDEGARAGAEEGQEEEKVEGEKRQVEPAGGVDTSVAACTGLVSRRRPKHGPGPASSRGVGVPPRERPTSGPLIDLEALAELVGTVPKDIRFKEATEARQLLNRAKQARARLRTVRETALQEADAGPTATVPKTQAGGACQATLETSRAPPGIEHVVEDGRAPASPSSPCPLAVKLDCSLGAGAGSPREAATLPSLPSLPSHRRFPPSLPPVSDHPTGARTEQWPPRSLSMKEALLLLRSAGECLPVPTEGIGEVVRLLLRAEAWARQACRRLGLHVDGKGGKDVGEEREKRKGGTVGEVSRLVKKLQAAYEGREGLTEDGGEEEMEFRYLDALEGGLADMVEMIMSREESQQGPRRGGEGGKEVGGQGARARGANGVGSEAPLGDKGKGMDTEREEVEVAGGLERTGEPESTEALPGTGGGPEGREGRRGKGTRYALLVSSTQRAARSTQKTKDGLQEKHGVLAEARARAVAAPGSTSPSSSASEEPLRCFCRLPETESKMRTLVNCDRCQEWYHPHCANFPVKALKDMKSGYLCPGCRHEDGLPSELACPPLQGGRGRGKGEGGKRKATLKDVEETLAQADKLAVYHFDALPFLKFVSEAAGKWRDRARRALGLLTAEKEKNAEAGREEEERSEGDASLQELARVFHGRRRERSYEERLRIEARVLRCVAGLLSEARVLELSVDEDLTRQLKTFLWRLIAPLCLPQGRRRDDCAGTEGAFDGADQASQRRSRVPVGLLGGVVEEGERLGLIHTPMLQRLRRVRDEVMVWLYTAATLSFAGLLPMSASATLRAATSTAGSGPLGTEASVGAGTELCLDIGKAPPAHAFIDLQAEWGYARAQAAALRWIQAGKGGGENHGGRELEWMGAVGTEADQFCLCRGPERGRMVECEGCQAWFHFECVGYRPRQRGTKNVTREGKDGGKGKGEKAQKPLQGHQNSRSKPMKMGKGKRGMGKKGDGGRGKTRKREAEGEEEGFKCIGCSEVEGVPYKHQWETPFMRQYVELRGNQGAWWSGGRSGQEEFDAPVTSVEVSNITEESSSGRMSTSEVKRQKEDVEANTERCPGRISSSRAQPSHHFQDQGTFLSEPARVFDQHHYAKPPTPSPFPYTLLPSTLADSLLQPRLPHSMELPTKSTVHLLAQLERTKSVRETDPSAPASSSFQAPVMDM